MPPIPLRREFASRLKPDAVRRGLASVREFRTAAVSAHRLCGAGWRWTPSPADPAVTAVLFASEGSLAVGRAAPARHAGVMLHSTHDTEVRATPDTLATVIWVDTDAVTDASAPASTCPVMLPTTPLRSGLQAFAESLMQPSEVQTRVSDHIVERLLVEMVYGVLLEHRETDGARHHAGRPMHRARMLMRLNRADPEYGLHELAQDLHVSTRHLQRLFANEGTSPANELRRLRAELALSLLRDPQYDLLSTAQIAAHAGFTNAAALRRGLQAIGAPTPQAARTR